MRYEITITLALDSDRSEERVVRQLESLIDFGTIKEALAEGLQLEEDPRLVGVSVRGVPGWEPATGN